MKLFKLAIIATAMVANVGCTTIKGWFNDKQLTAEQEQKIAKRNNGLVIPENFNNPAKSNEFVIPKNINHLPNSETITSPTSVLIILEKSWINEEDKHPAKIMIEKPDLVEDFPSFIQSGLDSFDTQRNISMEKVSAQQYKVEYRTYEEVGFWFWKTESLIEKVDLLLNLKMQDHKRSGEVFVDSVGYELVSEPSFELPKPATRKDDVAIQVLNDFMLELDYQYRVYLKKEQSGIDVTLKVAKNSSNIPVLISQQDITYVYSQMEDILEQLGFDIEDEDKILHSYQVSYQKDSQSMWDSIFNADYANKLDIASGEYKVELTTSVNGVYIKFLSVDGLPFTEQQVNQAYDLIMLVIKEDELEI